MRPLYRTLKALRIAASLLFLVLLTMFMAGSAVTLLGLTEFAGRVQIVPTLMGFSLGTLVAWVIITVVFGRIYCSSVCPIGTISDIFARLRPHRRYRYATSQQHISQALLALVVACALGGLSIVVGLLDPCSQWGRIVQACMHPTVAKCVIAGSVLIVIVLMAWMGGRLYCNVICPVGGALGLISRQAVFHIEIDPDRCIRCRRCVDVCKSQCIEIDTCTVDNSRCVDCFNCLPPCPVDAIRYTPDRKQLMTPMFRPIRPKGTAAAADTNMQSTSNQ